MLYQYNITWSIKGVAKNLIVGGLDEVERNRKNIVRRAGYDVDSFSFCDAADVNVESEYFNELDYNFDDDATTAAVETEMIPSLADVLASDDAFFAPTDAYIAQYDDAANEEPHSDEDEDEEPVQTGYMRFSEVAALLGVRYQQVYQRAFKLNKIRVIEGKVLYANTEDVLAWSDMRKARAAAKV